MPDDLQYHLRCEYVPPAGTDLAKYPNGFGFVYTRGWDWHTRPLGYVPPVTGPAWTPEVVERVVGREQCYHCEGNYCCDCNRMSDIMTANGLPVGDDDESPGNVCGETIRLKRLTLICPDGTSVEIQHGE